MSILASPLAPQQLPSIGDDSARSVSKNRGVAGNPKPPADVALASRQISVRPGDTLISIARRYPSPTSATTAQMLVALWQANQKAFTEENMNLLRSPVRLVLPSAEAVQAIDPEEARRTVQEQAKAFNEYRARLARETQTARAGVPAVRANVGRITSPQPLAAAPTAPVQDRLRLAQTEMTLESSRRTQASDATQTDSRVASKKAMTEAQTRIAELQKNLADIHEEMMSTDQSATTSKPAQGGVKDNAPALPPRDSSALQTTEVPPELLDAEFSPQADTALSENADSDEMGRIIVNGVLGGTAILGLLFLVTVFLLNSHRRGFLNLIRQSAASHFRSSSSERETDVSPKKE